MSFRSRLTLFFVVIVVVPMAAVGVVIFRLISDNESAKADARVGAFAAEAVNLYGSATTDALQRARVIAKDPVLSAALLRRDGAGVERRARTLLTQQGVVRIVVRQEGRRLADVGQPRALAPATVRIESGRGGPVATIQVSELPPARYAHFLHGPGLHGVVVRRGGRTLFDSVPGTPPASLPDRGTATVAGHDYRVASFTQRDFNGSAVRVSVFGDAKSGSSVAGSRALAAALIVGFFVLAFVFAVAVSRALQQQIGRFLAAARRLGSGDFSEPVPIEGHDEFAELGGEFNKMSSELERRLHELQTERVRLRRSIARLGESFAANLDHTALLELGLGSALDAVQGETGRTTLRERTGAPQREVARVGPLVEFADVIGEAEATALRERRLADASAEDRSALAAPIGPTAAGRRPHGVLSVARRGRPFGHEERELLTSLAAQAAISIENVELHHEVRRQAVTDGLTGLSNRRRFDEVMEQEAAASRRFEQELGLLMLDIDNFKKINDTYDHQQGDAVLKEVARVLQEQTREIDEPARYGGEEMAVALPQTDLEGAFTIAERVRGAIEELRVPRVDGNGEPLRVTASLGVASARDGEVESLIAAADAALYAAKRGGKNRVVRGGSGGVPEVPGDQPVRQGG